MKQNVNNVNLLVKLHLKKLIYENVFLVVTRIKEININDIKNNKHR